MPETQTRKAPERWSSAAGRLATQVGACGQEKATEARFLKILGRFLLQRVFPLRQLKSAPSSGGISGCADRLAIEAGGVHFDVVRPSEPVDDL